MDLIGLGLPHFYVPLLFINFKCFLLTGRFYVDWDFHISIYHYYLSALNVLCGLACFMWTGISIFLCTIIFFINFKCFMWTGMFYVDWDFHIFIYHYYLSTLNVLCWLAGLCGLGFPYFYVPLVFINYKCFMWTGISIFLCTFSFYQL